MGVKRSTLLYSVWERSKHTLSPILKPQLHYVGDSKTLHCTTTMREIWAHNTQLARQRQDMHFAYYAMSDMVYLRNGKCKCWKPKWLPGFRIIKLHGKTGRTKGVTL